MNYMLKILLSIFVIICSQSVIAFDGKRQGFVFGLGAGIHTTETDFTYSGALVESNSKSGLATTFKLGWGFANQFSLYYVRNASWYSGTYSDGFTTSEVIYALGISGLGATFYLNTTAPSFYLLGAYGIGDFSAPFESDISSDTGDSYMLGGGYEARRHLHLELTWLATDIDSTDDSQLKLESSSIQFTVNYLWY